MKINEFNSLLTKGRQRNFYMCDLALSSCLTCDDCTPQRQFIENKVNDNHTPKLNIACMSACACNPMQFIHSPDRHN